MRFSDRGLSVCQPVSFPCPCAIVTPTDKAQRMEGSKLKVKTFIVSNSHPNDLLSIPISLYIPVSRRRHNIHARLALLLKQKQTR